MKKLQMCIWIIIAIAILVLIGGCVYNLVLAKTENVVHPEVKFEIQNYGTVKMELYPEYAPNTVANIIKLVENGFYNNKVIYGKDEICMYVGRNSEGEIENPKLSLISDTVEPDTENDYEYTIPGEFVVNGYTKNVLRHEKGIVSLIRNDYTQYISTLSTESYNSGNAQLGIMMNNANNLNGVYAAFGKITEGLDILEKIYKESEIAVPEKTETENGAEDTTESTSEEEAIQVFKNYPVITSAAVDTHGINYGMPTVEKAFDYEGYLNNLLSSYYSN